MAIMGIPTTEAHAKTAMVKEADLSMIPQTAKAGF